MRMPETPITFEPVEIIRVTDAGAWCLIHGREVFVGPSLPQPGTTVRLKGDRGRLVLPKWFVRYSRLPIC